MRQCITVSVFIALLFNSIGSLFAASMMLNNAQQYADEDRILICTGSVYKWISLSSFEETGQLEFVDAPSNAPANLQEVKCSYAYLADPNSDDVWPTYTKTFTTVINNTQTLAYFNAIYATSRHQLALSRAPPLS
mgnify:CR=1 FL=1